MFLIRYLCLCVLTIIPMAIAHDFLNTDEKSARLQGFTLDVMDSLRVRFRRMYDFGEALRQGSLDNPDFIQSEFLIQLNEVIRDTNHYIESVFKIQLEKSAVPLEDDESIELETLRRYTEKINQLYRIIDTIYSHVHELCDYEFKYWIYNVYSQSDDEVRRFSEIITPIAAVNIGLMSTDEIESSGFNMMASICRRIGYFVNPEKKANNELQRMDYSINEDWATIIRDFDLLKDFIPKVINLSKD